jgi:ribonuclease-3
VVSVTGPEHNRVFECTVHHLGRLMGRGSGRSKKLAEGAAALDALEVLQGSLNPPSQAAATSGPTPPPA